VIGQGVFDAQLDRYRKMYEDHGLLTIIFWGKDQIMALPKRVAILKAFMGGVFVDNLVEILPALFEGASKYSTGRNVNLLRHMRVDFANARSTD